MRRFAFDPVLLFSWPHRHGVLLDVGSAFLKHPFVTHLPLLIDPSVDWFSCQPVGHSRIYRTVFNLNLSGIVHRDRARDPHSFTQYRFAPTSVVGIRNEEGGIIHGIKSRIVLPFAYACETFRCPLTRASKGRPASTAFLAALGLR